MIAHALAACWIVGAAAGQAGADQPMPSNSGGTVVTTDLSSLADPARVLRNPDCGWFHHFYDNDLRVYPAVDLAVLDAVPGLSLLYIRLPWSVFEPVEGRFDWTRIDDLVRVYAPRGYAFSIKVTCKETGTRFATPEWVRAAGARGTFVTNWGLETWEPTWDDPVFLAKLDAFQKAMAARYDGAAWLEDIDAGSYGDWGEGHTGFSTGKPATVVAVKRHLKLLLARWKKTRLVVGDDWLKWSRSAEEERELHAFAMGKGFALRDDSILVNWWLKERPASFSIDRPAWFEAVWRERPVTLECQHYHLMKKDGDWKGRNGSEAGAAALRGAIELAHPTWLGYHGWADEWLRENPDLTVELANRIGYRFVPVRAAIQAGARPGGSFWMQVWWENCGVAPSYRRYPLQLVLTNDRATHTSLLASSDCRRWMPGESIEEHYRIDLPASLPSGTYRVKIGLRRDAEPGARVVELGLKAAVRDPEGNYDLGSVGIGR